MYRLLSYTTPSPSPDRSEKPTVMTAYILCRGKATNKSSCKYIKMLPEERGLVANGGKQLLKYSNYHNQPPPSQTYTKQTLHIYCMCFANTLYLQP